MARAVVALLACVALARFASACFSPEEGALVHEYAPCGAADAAHGYVYYVPTPPDAGCVEAGATY